MSIEGIEIFAKIANHYTVVVDVIVGPCHTFHADTGDLLCTIFLSDDTAAVTNTCPIV